MRYTDKKEIEELISGFENRTLGRNEFDHAGHLTIALYLVRNFEFETAICKMREGLREILQKHGVDLEKENPYHETLTVFWVRTVFAFSLLKSEMPFMEAANELAAGFSKDYPLRFYSRELLFSKKARESFVEADL